LLELSSSTDVQEICLRVQLTILQPAKPTRSLNKLNECTVPEYLPRSQSFSCHGETSETNLRQDLILL
jgi:hypothetical protein